MGRRYSWAEGEGVSMLQALYAILDSDIFKASPIGDIYKTGEAVCLRLDGSDYPRDYDMVEDLRAEGASD
jgi:hypothetical protein